ncbi:ectonucleotide pyrophosphatase/phosphodiesterase [Sphingomonas sp.]|uniref:alkaline phosphatase family protein n=1 Tax=Sphingomonas sp. TaxID=28214 RepID=UPI003B3A36CC
MPWPFRHALWALLALIVAAPAQAARSPVTILVSIDAFRADYLDRGRTPTLSALAHRGISAAMRPSFPTKTFPNHYTLVTGLRPDRNGIIGNKMEDAARPGEIFTSKNSDDPFWWSEAEPLWAGAEKAGIRTGTMFWPGSNVAYDGVRPQDWFPYSADVTATQRVNTVLDWLRRPAASRPRFVTLYFDLIDTTAHHFGPDSPELNAALGHIDAQIAALQSGLAALHQPANLVIVADHGMAATSADRVVWLRDIATPSDYHVIDEGPVATIAATPGREDALAASLLRPHPHIHCLRKGALPERLHFGHNPRIAPFVCLADIGWLLLDKMPKKGVDSGSHGYDNAAPDMLALFIASGPSIKPAGRLPTFDNVDVYPLLRDLLGLPPKPGIDGVDLPFAHALRRR